MRLNETVALAITQIDDDLVRAAFKARNARTTAPQYAKQHLREAELLAESARVQLQYAMLALERESGTS